MPGKKVLAFLLASGAWGWAADAEILRLSVGQQQVLAADDITRASLADPKVCDLTRTSDDREFILIARKAGRTDLVLWKKDGSKRTVSIEVGENDPRSLAQQIQDLLAGIPGITVKAVGERVLVDGKLLTRKDQERVHSIAQAYPSVLNLTSLDLSGHNDLLSREVARKIGFPLVTVEILQDKAVLKGTVFREEDKKTAAEIAKAYVPEVVNLLSIDRPMTEIDVKFILVQRTRSEERGTNILKNLGGTVSVATDLKSATYALSASALVRLKELSGSGEAHTVAEPFLVTASGKEATFHSGGEQGYRVSGTGAADVKFKKFGLLLSVLPEVQSTGEIRTRISLEVSAPNRDAAGGDIAFTTFKTESEVSSRIDETILLAGILEGLKDRFQEKTPVLGDIPILAEFFREKGERSSRKELVVMVTPRVPVLTPAKDPPVAKRIPEPK